MPHYKQSPTAVIFDIERCSYVDGPGIRTTVFFKGCNLNCPWCHNPESQSAKPQMMFYQDKCIGCGTCKTVCPTPRNCTLCGKCALLCPVDARKICGKEYTVDEVFAEIIKDKAYYETSGGGVTFSGGECMLQLEILCALLKKCKEHSIHTAVDTAGHVPFERFAKILPDTDLFLYDIKLLDPEKHKKYVGADNRLILENLQKLFSAGANIWIRIPVIPGINDTVEQMQSIKAFLDACGSPEKVELLPYHSMGENKHRALGKAPLVFNAPDAKKMDQLKQIFAV